MIDVIGEAEEYELFGYPHTTTQDCDFLAAVFAAQDREVRAILDIACGTGRHALEMAKRGYRVTGFDISEDMLETAAQRAAEQELDIRFVQGDMAWLDLGGEFDAAYILFNTISLLTRNDDLIRFMQGVHRCLAQGGLLVIEVGNLWPYIGEGKLTRAKYESEEVRGGVKRCLEAEISLDLYDNIMHRRERKRYWRDEEELESKTENICTRIFSRNELDLLCRLTGFRILQVFGATDVNARIEDVSAVEAEKPHNSYVLALQKMEV